MFQVPFIGGHTRGRSDHIDAQECVNWYPDVNPHDKATNFTLIPTPGLTKIATTPNAAIPRGMVVHKGTLYVVADNDLYQYNQTTDTWSASLGTLNTTGTGKVIIASSGYQGEQLLIVDGQSVYVFYDTGKAGTITGVTNASPAVVSSSGHGLVDGDQIVISGVLSGTGAPGATTGTLAVLVNATHIITKVDADSFSLNGINTSTADTYQSGGTFSLNQFFEPGLGTNTGFLEFSSASSISGSGANWANPTSALTNGGGSATATIPGYAIALGQEGTGTTDAVSTSYEIISNGGGLLNPRYARTSDNNRTNFISSAVSPSHTLQCYNWGFSVPTTATIVGIDVRLEYQAILSGAGSLPFRVWLGERVNDTTYGSYIETNLSSTTDATATVGGPSTMWGATSTLTPGVINSSDFCINLQTQVQTPNNIHNILLDQARVRVYYNLPTDFLRVTQLTSTATIATSDIITGIEFNIEKKSSVVGFIKDNSVRVVKGGAAVGDDNAVDTNWSTAAAQTTTYGGSTDLWGTTWTSTDINAGNFGVQISAKGPGTGTATAVGSIDYIKGKIYYQTSGVVPATFAVWADNYFIINEPGTGRFYITNQGAQKWALNTDFATTERDPDTLVAMAINKRELWLLGTDSTEVWYDSGNIFPWDPISNAFSEWGIAAANTIAKLDETLLWLAQNKQGGYQVVMTNGYQVVPITPPSIVHTLSKIEDISGASAFAYQQDGHQFYVLNLGDSTWVYDLGTQTWHRRASGGEQGDTGRAKPELHVFDGKKHYVSAYDDTNLYVLSTDVFTENGTVMYRTRTSQRLTADVLGVQGGSRNIVYYRRFEVDASTGTEQPSLKSEYDTDRAKIGLSWSDDNGQSWTEPLWRVLGAADHAGKRLQWQLLGSSRERIFRLETQSKVDVILMNAYVDASVGAR